MNLVVKAWVFSVLFLPFFITALSSQSSLPEREYQDIVFNCKYEWYDADFNSKMESDSCDGYNRLNSYSNPVVFIDNDHVYTGMEVHYNRLLYAGFMITKRNLQSGALQWQYYVDLDSVDRQEVVINIQKKNNDELYVTSLRQVAPPGQFDFGVSREMVLVRRSLDIASGKLKSILSTSSDSIQLLNYTNFKTPIFNSLLLYNTDTTSVVRKYDVKYNNGLTDLKLDQREYFLLRSTMNVQRQIEISDILTSYNYIPEDSMHCGILARVIEMKDTTVSRTLKYYKFDNHLNSKEVLEYSLPENLSNIPFTYLGPIKNAGHLIYFQTDDEKFDSTLYQFYVLSNITPQIIAAFSIKENYNRIQRIKYFGDGDIDQAMLFVSGWDRRPNESNYVFLDTYILFPEFRKVNRMASLDYLRFIQIEKTIGIDSSHLLLLATQNSLLFKSKFQSIPCIDHNAFAHTISLWNLNSFTGCINNSAELFENKLNLDVYPNPCSHNLSIRSNGNLGNCQVDVYDLLGTSVIHQIGLNIEHKDSGMDMDVSLLKDGVYIIQLKEKNIIYSKLFIKH